MTDTRDPEGWVARQKAPEVAGVSQRKIDGLLADGTLTKYKDGLGRVWIKREELEALMIPRPETEPV